MIRACRWILCFAPMLAFSAPVFLESQFELPPGFRIYRAATAELSAGSYDLTFDGQGRLLVGDGNAIRRLKDAAEKVGFELAGARIDEAPTREPRTGKGTSYVPLDDSAGHDAEG